MANTILHKRNLSTGNNPTTASLEPGELAINVADGKLFLRQSGSVVNKIITVGESASFAATASYVNPLQQNVQLTGSLYLSTPGVASIYFTGSGIPGQLTWNDTDGTLELGLKGGVVKSELGQGLVTRVVNKTVPNVDLSGSNYQVVVVAGAQGQRLAVKLAQADNDANSAGTLGIVAENIDKNQEGFIITVGLLKNRDTTGALQGETWNDGDVLYLSPTTAGAITNVKPQAPQHTIIVGYVEYAHAINGKLYVKIDNGYEIDELHNVRITTASLAAGQLLVRSGSNATGVWINTNQLTGSYGLTGSLTATSFTGSLHGTSSWAQNALTASFAQTASYVLQAVSASYAPDTTFPYTGSAIVSGSLLVTGSFSVLDVGGVNNINSAVRSLYGETGTLSVDWNNRLLSNASGVTTVDWRNNRLIDTSTTRSIDWQNRSLIDDTSIQSIDWRTRTALDTNQSSSIVWSTRVLTDSGTPNGLGTPVNSIDWENRQTYDENGLISMYWGTIRSLMDSTTNTSIDWENRTLSDSTSATSFKWNTSNQGWVLGTTTYINSQIRTIEQESFISTYNNIDSNGIATNVAGEVIGVSNIDAGVAIADLISLGEDGIWYQTDQSGISGSAMLGIYIGSNYVLTDGTIGAVTASGISNVPFVDGTSFYGKPVYMRPSVLGGLTTTKPASGYVRVVGHMYKNSTTDSNYWIMKFRPSNDWYEI